MNIFGLMYTLMGVGGTTSTLSTKEQVRNGGGRALSTSVASAATTIAGLSLNAHDQAQLYEKYRSACIDSMSDEELAMAIERLEGKNQGITEVSEIESVENNIKRI